LRSTISALAFTQRGLIALTRVGQGFAGDLREDRNNGLSLGLQRLSNALINIIEIKRTARAPRAFAVAYPIARAGLRTWTGRRRVDIRTLLGSRAFDVRYASNSAAKANVAKGSC